MAAVIHIVHPQRTKMCEYTDTQIRSYWDSKMISEATGVYAVWETHVDASLKSHTRVKRDETASGWTRISSKISLTKGAE